MTWNILIAEQDGIAKIKELIKELELKKQLSSEERLELLELRLQIGLC